MVYKLLLFYILLYISKFYAQKTTTTLAPWQLRDNMGIADKTKMQDLAKELMWDTKLKLRQVIAILNDHARNDAYHYGYVIGKIRENYRNMLEIYKTARNRLPGFRNALVLPPSTRVVRPVHYIQYMISINVLERENDEMVRLLEWINKGAATLNADINPPPGFAPPLLRTRQEVIKNIKEMETKKKLRSDERRLKSKIRQAHLMRKIGLPVNSSTTKKRFVDRWPVEDTWRLNDYETV